MQKFQIYFPQKCALILSLLYIQKLIVKKKFQAVPHILPFNFGEESINEGDTMAVNCMISKGDLPLKIEWLHEGTLIPKQSSTSGINIINMSARLSTLNFEYIRGEHRGNYTCMAKKSRWSS